MIDVKNMIPIERDFSTNIALENVLDVIQELQLRPRIDFLNEQAQVTNLKLLDLDGNIVSEGSGKGEHHKIGALAESIEHYFLDKEQNSDLLKLRNLIANINLFNDGLIQHLSLFNLDEELLCERLESVHPIGKSRQESELEQTCIDIPLILRDVCGTLSKKNNDAENFLSKYSTNSGVAFGCSRNEAILHAALEIICSSHDLT